MFLLIDGSSLLTTNFMGNLPPEIKFCKDDDKYDRYADKILHTSNGIYTNGVYSTLMDIMNIIRIHRPEYMAVAFDKTRDTFRRKLYPEYKAQRKPKPECLQQQFTTLKAILNELGIMVLESGDYEADDLIGSVASHFENPFMKIKILTKDHDYLQLKTDNIDVWTMQTSGWHCCCLDHILHESCPQKHKPICSKQWFNRHCFGNDSILSHGMLPAACYSNSVYTCNCKVMRVRKAFKC